MQSTVIRALALSLILNLALAVSGARAETATEAVQGVVSTVHDFPAASIGVRRFWPARTAAARLRGIPGSPDSGCRAVGQSSRVST